MNLNSTSGRAWARAGAVFYALWGLLHVAGGASLLAQGLADPAAGLRAMATGAGTGAFGNGPGAVTGALFTYHSFNLVWLGLLVTALALVFNWRNSAAGFWLNLSIVGAVDLGLVWTMMKPGYIPVSQGGIGVGLFLAAALCSGIARLTSAALPIGQRRRATA